MEHVELHLLIAIGDTLDDITEDLTDVRLAQYRQGRRLASIETIQEAIMVEVADLSELTAALEEVKSSAETASAAVLAALAATSVQLSDLRTQIDVLVAGNITQAQINALTDTAKAADVIVDQITAAVTPAVVEPPVEPPVETPVEPFPTV
jgi:2-hydroxychromene-2-carboxylate isomerase